MLDFIDERQDKTLFKDVLTLDTGESKTFEDEESFLNVFLIKSGDENKIMQVLTSKKDLTVKVMLDGKVGTLTVAEVINFISDNIKKLPLKSVDDLKEKCVINEKTNRVHARIKGEHQVFDLPTNNLMRGLQQSRSELKTNRVLIEVK